MTLTEYLSQTKPQKLSSGVVELSNDEVQILSTLTFKDGKKYTVVYLKFFSYSYLLVNGSNTLRTMDENGNPKGWSVFSYVLPQKEIVEIN